MAAATVIQYVSDFCNIPGVEIVDLEVSDGETYMSRKFSAILGAVVCRNADSDNHTNVTFSGKTATINAASATDARMTLILFGRK